MNNKLNKPKINSTGSLKPTEVHGEQSVDEVQPNKISFNLKKDKVTEKLKNAENNDSESGDYDHIRI